MISKEVVFLSYEGQAIPQEVEVNIQQDSVLSAEMSDVFVSLVQFESHLRLNKWASKVVESNFERLSELKQAN